MNLNYVDEIELDVTFQDGVAIPDTVWAIVSKSHLKAVRESRWDLVSSFYGADHAWFVYWFCWYFIGFNYFYSVLTGFIWL